jgi:methylase of polypeptide subunit release factors
MSSNVKEAKKAALPSLDHITLEDEQSVYIPSDDTFLLCDALLLDIDSFSMPSVVSVLEIG